MSATLVLFAVVPVVLKLTTALTKKGLGERVSKPENCKSGKFLRTRGLLSISGVCTDDCNVDSDCGDTERLACHESKCVPRGKRAFGEGCDALWDCASYLCVIPPPAALSELMSDSSAPLEMHIPYCSRSCSFESGECPDGYRCEPTLGSSACAKHPGEETPQEKTEDLLWRLEKRTGDAPTRFELDPRSLGDR